MLIYVSHLGTQGFFFALHAEFGIMNVRIFTKPEKLLWMSSCSACTGTYFAQCMKLLWLEIQNTWFHVFVYMHVNQLSVVVVVAV